MDTQTSFCSQLYILQCVWCRHFSTLPAAVATEFSSILSSSSRRGWPQPVQPRSPYPFAAWERIQTPDHRAHSKHCIWILFLFNDTLHFICIFRYSQLQYLLPVSVFLQVFKGISVDLWIQQPIGNEVNICGMWWLELKGHLDEPSDNQQEPIFLLLKICLRLCWK